ncbi:hypothetical protein J5N97_024882 [Dioscorea zingiberensis]|uniref:Uncharacterized protein n=1 Tax=Dioscorea zingiberensis TaxID=325984 RepID=A0A9D5H9C7_9LILI|nr:hypothetical protein J5N97_024882 [Dioscorea zingiberensis]
MHALLLHFFPSDPLLLRPTVDPAACLVGSDPKQRAGFLLIYPGTWNYEFFFIFLGILVAEVLGTRGFSFTFLFLRGVEFWGFGMFEGKAESEESKLGEEDERKSLQKLCTWVALQKGKEPCFLEEEKERRNKRKDESPFMIHEERLAVQGTVRAAGSSCLWCFQGPETYLEIVVYMGRRGSHCGVTSRKQQIGTFRVLVGPEWGEGKAVLLHNGWINIGKQKKMDKPGLELHLKVKLDPDPRYVFHFEDETSLSPQIVQLKGTIKQPIFSCKFSRDRRASQLDQMGNYWLNDNDADQETERRERKGWKLVIHDLSGSAVAAAFMATPFVPATGFDRVAKSNPGAWLILRPDPVGPSESWLPWGRLEAWRETSHRDFVCLRLYLLPEGQEAGVLVSDIMISADKGGDFFIDMDRQTPVGAPVPALPNGAGEDMGDTFGGVIDGGFVMNCRVQGEGKGSKPLVQLAVKHVTCVEDAAIFMALAAAVDLSIEACKPFRRAKKLLRQTS